MSFTCGLGSLLCCVQLAHMVSELILCIISLIGFTELLVWAEVGHLTYMPVFLAG